MYEDETLKENDEWCKFQPAVDEFNWIRSNRVLSAFWMIVDETMSAWRPRISPTGNLPNISYIFRKPEPLGEPLVVCFPFLFSC